MSHRAQSLLSVLVVLAVICPLCVMSCSDESDADSKSLAGYGSSGSITVRYSEGLEKGVTPVGILEFEIPGFSALRDEIVIRYDDVTGVSISKNMLAGMKVSLNDTLGKGLHTVSVSDGDKTFSTDFTVGIELKKMVLSPGSFKGTVGDTVTLELEKTPWNAMDSDIVWHSSDEGVAEVDSDGKVTLVGVGTAFVKAESMSTGLEQVCSIGVETEPLPVPEGPDGPGDPDDGSSMPLLIGAGAAVVAVALLAVFLLHRRG